MTRKQLSTSLRPALAAIALAALPSACAPTGDDLAYDEPLPGSADGVGLEAELDAELRAMALGAAEVAHAEGRGLGRPTTLTIVNFALSSAHMRLWVLDTASGEVLFHERVAHGSGSGDAQNATRFSNVENSNMSSLGLFEVNETGVGRSVGAYVAVDGLEPGWNSEARTRQILIHGASYASDAYFRRNGYTGRSHGCFAVRPDVMGALSDAVSGGSLLFAYYPDEDYLATSAYASDAPTTPWVGSLCDPGDDDACGFTYAGGHGYCFDEGGYCSIACEGYCHDRVGHGESFCVASPEGGGMCAPLASERNHDCADVPQAEAREAARFVGRSGAPARTARVCLPSS